jgi:putative acetyltransferase
MYIRSCKCEDDEVSVLSVFNQTFPVSHSFLENREQTQARQHLALLLGHSETLIAEVDSSAVGFITMDGKGYISALYVDRAHVGRGVGSALLQAAQDRHQHFKLHVFSDNVFAVQFYKARGFVVVDEDIQIDSAGYRHRRFEMERINDPNAWR